ncbi:putative cytochrome P450 oxidoreductase [Xylaria flabelliformis]|nr:putative cytochrome P450 oxidoreductase [Xylaria flabelliformis]
MISIEILVGILFAAAAVIGVKSILFIFKKKPGPLPPGPKGLPLLGNIRDLPTHGEREWEHWLKHKDIYGPISSVTTLGTTFVLLHSSDLALELMEKRSSKYSSRPRQEFADLTGWTNILGMRQYGETHRLHRKVSHMLVGTHLTVMPYLPIQEIEVRRFLFRVLKEPKQFLNHIRTEAGAIILKIVYGYTVEPSKPDPLIDLADEAMFHFAAASTAGTWWVDVIPALKSIPEWMPGTGWKKIARRWRATLDEVSKKPLLFAQRRLANGRSEKSFVTDFHKSRGDTLSPEDNEVLRWVAMNMYAGGADTTVNTITSFFFAMILFPEVQRKAQEEIDRVIGNSRLPTYSDREDLPYINAVLTEAWRWHTVVPMALPHVTTSEDIVNGYFIPKGSLVIPNIWWFTHDPAVYPNPSEFDPSRYLGPDPAPDPTTHIFGYGRRICPGRYLADTSTWLTIAQSLAVFNISKGLDESGIEIEPIPRPTPGAISRLEPFKATIKPRSPQHEFLIRQVEELHPWEAGSADELRRL